MSKRKSNPCAPTLSIASLDSALDLLAHETFTRLYDTATKFSKATGVHLEDSIVRARWAEAANRYDCVRSMEKLCAQPIESAGRPLPTRSSPGPTLTFQLTAEEEREWRRWQPKQGDQVLVQLSDGVILPAKVGLS
jgi:hypothetical protein